ncbi:hypothetical protein Nepgr_022444 [Nepenthes gracilis]|uniref:Uncharacterized protein n=1 Tax=Nepenthes gracilis TaxID=150966 RepID=A0AAD3T0A7_NEPGR|nr:hypothetical protein Nepgr_022444 [Nepenthes gracilis]
MDNRVKWGEIKRTRKRVLKFDRVVINNGLPINYQAFFSGHSVNNIRVDGFETREPETAQIQVRLLAPALVPNRNVPLRNSLIPAAAPHLFNPYVRK